jgi:hypothetical protein
MVTCTVDALTFGEVLLLHPDMEISSSKIVTDTKTAAGLFIPTSPQGRESYPLALLQKPCRHWVRGI